MPYSSRDVRNRARNFRWAAQGRNDKPWLTQTQAEGWRGDSPRQTFHAGGERQFHLLPFPSLPTPPYSSPLSSPGSPAASAPIPSDPIRYVPRPARPIPPPAPAQSDQESVRPSDPGTRGTGEFSSWFLIRSGLPDSHHTAL
jgi:hypothetical protein